MNSEEANKRAFQYHEEEIWREAEEEYEQERKKMFIYTVHDTKAEAFLTPFFARNDAVAIRNFTAAIRDETHMFSRNAADYTLFKIGEFSEDVGAIHPADALENLGNALPIKAKLEREKDGGQ